jgi:hypothetical protein
MNPAPSGRHGQLEAQLTQLIAPRAKAVGLVMTGQFNLGDSERDYRVPDGGLHRAWSDSIWYPTAVLALEIISPGDESYQKLPFYAAHRVDEAVIVDPDRRQVEWLGLAGDKYEPVKTSGLIELGAAELAQRIDWP